MSLRSYPVRMLAPAGKSVQTKPIGHAKRAWHPVGVYRARVAVTGRDQGGSR
jgi:hypothetical protein